MMTSQGEMDGMSAGGATTSGSFALAGGVVDSSMEFDGGKADGENLSGKRERDPATERLRSKSAPVVTAVTAAKPPPSTAPIFHHSSAEESSTTLSAQSSDESNDRPESCDDDVMDLTS